MLFYMLYMPAKMEDLVVFNVHVNVSISKVMSVHYIHVIFIYYSTCTCLHGGGQYVSMG